MTIHSTSDHGYQPHPMARCIACGSCDLDCCDGTGKRLSFKAWKAAVDRRICEIDGVPSNKIAAPYADVYRDGLTVGEAVEFAFKCGSIDTAGAGEAYATSNAFDR